jgi:hypothetical protein
MFVAADRLAGDPIDMGEPMQSAAGQYRVHGRGGHVAAGTDLDRAQVHPHPVAHDLAHELWRGLDRAVVGPAGPVVHTGRTELAVALGPAFRGRPGDLEPLGGLGDRQAVLDDQSSQP